MPKGKRRRVTVGLFVNWLARNLPRCVYPQNNRYSTIGLGKKQRNFVLKAYGYGSYKDYLGSDLWASIRAKVLRGARCACGCDRVPNQVHHRAYTEANLMGITLDGLVALSGDCHHEIEFSDDRKTNLAEANTELKERQYRSVAYCKPPTEDEVKLYLAGRHKKLSLERKLAVKKYLKDRHSN